MRYREYADRLREIAGTIGFEVPESGMALCFYLPMPASWSKKKRRAMNGAPHQQKPDVDNLTKALLDALCEEDSFVWQIERMEKRWAEVGHVVVTVRRDDLRSEQPRAPRSAA